MSNNGLEFTSSEAVTFFQSKGILHQKTCPYTLQQNGIVERKHKYLLEIARALLFQSKLSLKYWGEFVLMATYIINKLPTSSLNNKCPYEVLFTRKPIYSYLRSFGCRCFPTTPKVHRDKFEPKSIPHFFIGYPFETKGYRVLNLFTKRISISRDVIFHEHVFPFYISNKADVFSSVLPLVFVPFVDYSIPTSRKESTQPVHTHNDSPSTSSPSSSHQFVFPP